jgi:hypothetical protein
VDLVRKSCAAEPAENGADLFLLAPPRTGAPAAWAASLQALAVWAAARPADARPALGLEVPLGWVSEIGIRRALSPWARVSIVMGPESIQSIPADMGAQLAGLPPLQYTLALENAGDRSVVKLAGDLERVAMNLAATLPPGAVALDFDTAPRGPHAWRRFLAAWNGPPPPLVLRGPRRASSTPVDAHTDTGAVEAAASLGALLADGVGDAVQLHASNSVGAARQFAHELLQATRLRLTRADFIACPSCGRTQFDLQTTTARIEARFRHLRGLKIAIMGCIVNGPGEMADADFGYVGSGPGKIDLYVRHERVERNVPQAEAVEKLVDLIRERGLWVDPPSS